MWLASFWYEIFSTPFGWVVALASEKGLRATSLPLLSPGEAMDALAPEVWTALRAPERFLRLRRFLRGYFGGQRVSADMPLDLDGVSPFLQAAWRACQQIPQGETRSYSWLAAAVRRPRAFRAVGQAMARNRLPLVVPCHRVIGSNGRLQGYGGGLELKARLLELEAQAQRRC